MIGKRKASRKSHRRRWRRWTGTAVVLTGWALWNLWKRYLQEPTTTPKEQEPVEIPLPPDLVEPSAPAATTLDDLRLIEGIGPKVAELLHAAEINTFAQLAETDSEKLRGILCAAGLPFMNPTTWPQQAALATTANLQALEDLQATLKGGRST